MEHLRACEEVVEVHEDANTHIHESHEGRMPPPQNLCSSKVKSEDYW
jgi:hypothetical protein